MSFENDERSEGLSLSTGPGLVAVLTTPIRCFQRGYSPSSGEHSSHRGGIQHDLSRCDVTFDHWVEDANGLHAEFRFPTFSEAWDFMSSVAEIAERLEHHPDWCNSWNRVSITLISHDVGCVTERDRTMADLIGGLVEQMKGVTVDEQ
jgi:4a-hydroxytetrahydrobiopterin dehydratase